MTKLDQDLKSLKTIKDYIDNKTPTSAPQAYVKKDIDLVVGNWTSTTPILLDKVSAELSYKTLYGNFSKYLVATSIEDWKAWQTLADNSISNMAIRSVDYRTDSNSLRIEAKGSGLGTYPILYVIIYVDRIEYARGSSYSSPYSIQCINSTLADFTQTILDEAVKVNSEVTFTLDEANGKIAGKFGLRKAINKETGKITFTTNSQPTIAITGTLEIGETSTEGAAFVEGIIEPQTSVQTNIENTFTKTQTFNGTESQAGIKTNAIDNENGDRVVYFDGTKQMFGSGAVPTQVRSSEQRLKLERPISGGTGTEIVEVANLSDVGHATSLTLTAPNGNIYVVSVDNSGQIVLTKQ